MNDTKFCYFFISIYLQWKLFKMFLLCSFVSQFLTNLFEIINKISKVFTSVYSFHFENSYLILEELCQANSVS